MGLLAPLVRRMGPAGSAGRTRGGPARLAVTVAGALSLTGALAAAPPASAATTPSASANFIGALSSVSAVSANDAWAAGTNGAGESMLLRWNGTSWAEVTIPRPGTPGLEGVSADSASDAWAVGDYITPSSDMRTMALRWNGTTWTQVTTPNPRPSGHGSLLDSLVGVSADSPTDAWAVGFYGVTGSTAPLVLHWTGTAWHRGAFPAPAHSEVFAVSALSASDVWAVGHYLTGGRLDRILIMHWNGTAWSRMPVPNLGTNLDVLTSVSARSPGDVWAAGSYATATTGNYRTMVLHWNGTTWTHVPSPSPAGPGQNAFSDLAGISADSPGDAWAVGTYGHTTARGGTGTPLLLHWNGTAWNQVAGPSSPGNSGLGAVDALSATDAWAVGGHFSRDSVGNTVQLRWNGTAWTSS